MKHMKQITIGQVRVSPADILGTRAFVSLLTDIIGLLSGLSSLLKGMPVGGVGEVHDDEEEEHEH